MLLQSKKTFTLIELLIVVVTIGILSVALVPRLMSAQERSRDSSRAVKVGQFSAAIWIMKEDTWAYPIAPFYVNNTAQSSVAMIPELNRYMSSIPTDPGKWLAAVIGGNVSCVLTGDSFAYNSDATGSWFAITSLNESKRGNADNCLWITNSPNNASYATILEWSNRISRENLVAMYKDRSWVYYVWNEIIVTDGTPTGTYIMQNKNVGASNVGVDSVSYGCHFQWWNNNCFSSIWSVPTTSAIVNASAYSPTNPYNENLFIMPTSSPNDWTIPQNNNLWWDTTNTLLARRWPCDENYHVPAVQERQWLYGVWRNIYSWDARYNTARWSLFMETLFLPMAWYRYNLNAQLYVQTTRGRYWASNPNGVSAHNMSFDAGSIGQWGNGRADGFSVRCFKN